MPPITFRNVNAPDFRAGNALLQSANQQIQNAIGSGVSQLRGLARGQEDDATSAAINRINQLDVAGVEAAKASGEFGDVRFADTNKVLAALQGRTAAARSEDNADFTAGQNLLTQERQELEQAEAPRINAIRASLVRGETEDARAAIDNGEFSPETVVSLEQEFATRSKQLVQEGRIEDEFQLKQKGVSRTNTLNAAILGLQADREDKVLSIQEANTAFASSDASQGIVSFDGTGKLVIAEEFRGSSEVPGIIAQYVAIRKEGPTLKSARERRDEFSRLALEQGATPAQLNDGLAELRRYDEGLLELEQEDKALLAGANERDQDIFTNALEEEGRVRDLVLKEFAEDTAVTAMQEDARGGNSVQPGELIDTDIAIELANPDSSLGNLADDSEAGEEIPRLKKLMNDAVDAGFDRGTENLDFPGWVVRAAYKSVGLRGMYKDRLFDETITGKPFEAALKRIMKQHLKSENNSLLRAQAESAYSSKKLQLKQTLGNVQSANKQAARSRSGVFTDSGLPPLLDREAARLAQSN